MQAYLYCIAGFISIWLIYDISDNVSTFIDQGFGVLRVMHYYATQVPQVLVVMLLPVALLLALLFCLGRMSRANEIVSMLTAGVSVPRVLAPLIIIGLLTVAASFALNYEVAPHSDLVRKNFLNSDRGKKETRIEGQIFRNRTDNRTWFIQYFHHGGSEFHNVQVLQQNENDKITDNYIATRASYDSANKTWDLQNVKIV